MLLLVILVALGDPLNLTVVLKGEALPLKSVGVNGTFFCRKCGRLANFLVRNSQVVYPFPYWATSQRGCLIVKDGKAEIKLLSANEAIKIQRNPKGYDLVLGGGGYFLRKGKLATDKDLRSEGLTPYIINHKHFAFVAVHRNGKVLIGVSRGESLWMVGKVLIKLGFVDAMRLDGGGATAVWRSPRKFPPNTNNLLVIRFPLATGKDNLCKNGNPH